MDILPRPPRESGGWDDGGENSDGPIFLCIEVEVDSRPGSVWKVSRTTRGPALVGVSAKQMVHFTPMELWFETRGNLSAQSPTLPPLFYTERDLPQHWAGHATNPRILATKP